MKEFTYTIRDELGLHARAAGELVKKAKSFKSSIKLEKDGRTASATGMFAIMGLCVKQHDTVTVKVSGEDEDNAARSLEEFFAANL